MRKTNITFIIILVFLFVYIVMNIAANTHCIEYKGESGNISSLPFREGEMLVYEVRYKKAKIGKSILTFHGERDLRDSKVYYITFSTKVPSFKDTEELYADKDTFFPIEVHRSIKKLIGFNDRIIEKYDQENFKVEISSKSKLRSKNFSIEKDSNIHNAILLTYYYRTKESFTKNEKFEISLPTVDFEVMYKGMETIETHLGEYRAHVFTSEPPKFSLYLSADEKRIPLKIENPGKLGYSLIIKSIERK